MKRRPAPAIEGGSSQVEQAMDHLRYFFQRYGRDPLAEHLLEDLDVVQVQLDQYGTGSQGSRNSDR